MGTRTGVNIAQTRRHQSEKSWAESNFRANVCLKYFNQTGQQEMFQKISFAVWSLKICWCLRVLDEAGGGGRMVFAEVGQELSLSCAYDLEEDVLHSLKWYRGDKEFYRYLPRDSSSPVTIYPLDGVSVSPRASPTLLVLDKVSSATNGVFK